MVNQELLFEALADFPRVLVEKRDPADVLRTLVERLTSVMGVAGAGVSLLVSELPILAAANDDSIVPIEQAQEQARRGPCIDARRVGQPVVASDLAEFEAEWPEVVAAAAKAGVRAAAAIPIQLDGETVGVLDLYDTEAREWSEQDLRAARALADMALALVVLLSRLQSAERRAEQLQHALDQRVIIEQAKGMLAADRQVSPDEAFEQLRKHSRDHNVAVHEVAAAVVRVGLRP